MAVPTIDEIRSVAFVKDLQQFQTAQSLYPDTERYLTPSLSLYHHLRNEPQRTQGTWDYLGDEDRKQIVLEATRLKDAWYQDLKTSFLYRGVNMGEALKFSVYYFLFEALSANRIAKRFFRNAPSRLRLPAISGTPVRYSLHTQSSVPEAVFAFHAQTAGVPVDWIKDASERGIAGSTFGIEKFVPEWLLRLRRRVRNSLSATPQSELAQQFPTLKAAQVDVNSKQSRYTAICASCFQNFLMLLPMASELEKTPDWSVLRLHTVASLDYAASLKDPSAVDFVSPDNPERFAYLELYRVAADMPAKGSSFISRLWKDFVAWQRTYGDNYPAIFANTNLTFQFEYLLRRLMQEACMLVDAASEIFEKIRPDVLLVGNGSEKDQTLAAVGQSRGIPTVLVPHNRVWAYPEVYDLPVDYVAVRNQGTAEFLKNVIGKRKSIVVGDLKPQKRKAKVASMGKEETRELRDERRILLLLGWVSPGLFQFFNIGASYNALRELLSEVSRRPDWKLRFRYHPRTAALLAIDDLIRDAVNTAPGQVTIETERSAEEAIPDADVLVLFDYRSSPVIAAWKHRVPVIYWRSAKAFYSSDDMLKEEIFLTVASFDEFESTMDRLTSDKIWREGWVENGHRFAEKYFSDPDLPDVHLPELVQSIIQNKQ